ncbi:APX2 [Bugula neritina]|uniref:APX2 n=1 Tax=Bugula neritina TaxID=10212 RepID=A0A7J7JD47_BUGNE|nr:APX2 [Bugula neritina]
MYRLGFILLLLPSTAEGVTTAEEAQAKASCRSALQNNRKNIAGFVRLAFHDCVGGCNGCVNLNLVDPTNSDRPNAGLMEYVNELENKIATGGKPASMSRADFWILCSVEALQTARQNAGRAPLNINMVYGRQDCPDGPYTASTVNAANFPNPRQGLAVTVKWCLDTFGLSSQFCVALLGAHTLGRARARFSGFEGAWVRGAGEFHLNNGYYRELVEGPWIQNNNNPGSNNLADHRWQFEKSGRLGQPNLLMLNADMCLLKDIQPHAISGR